MAIMHYERIAHVSRYLYWTVKRTTINQWVFFSRFMKSSHRINNLGSVQLAKGRIEYCTYAASKHMPYRKENLLPFQHRQTYLRHWWNWIVHLVISFLSLSLRFHNYLLIFVLSIVAVAFNDLYRFVRSICTNEWPTNIHTTIYFTGMSSN